MNWEKIVEKVKYKAKHLNKTIFESFLITYLLLLLIKTVLEWKVEEDLLNTMVVIIIVSGAIEVLFHKEEVKTTKRLHS